MSGGVGSPCCVELARRVRWGLGRRVGWSLGRGARGAIGDRRRTGSPSAGGRLRSAAGGLCGLYGLCGLSGPGVVETSDHLIPAFVLLGAQCRRTVRPAAGLLVIQGGSRGGNRPALAVDREAQLCVVGLPVTELGTGFGVGRVAVAAWAEGEAGAVVSAFVRWWALIRATAGHGTHLKRDLIRCEVVSLPFVM